LILDSGISPDCGKPRGLPSATRGGAFARRCNSVATWRGPDRDANIVLRDPGA
jgi:hypothetical protein